MATKYITLKGKSEWCKPWPFQIDRHFEEPGDAKGGNSATTIILDDESLVAFLALGAKKKLKDGTTDKLTVQRYERHPTLGELGHVVVTGVDEGTLIGNGSDISVVLEVYDFEYKGKTSRGTRWVSVNVDNLVAFEAPAANKPAVGVPVF